MRLGDCPAELAGEGRPAQCLGEQPDVELLQGHAEPDVEPLRVPGRAQLHVVEAELPAQHRYGNGFAEAQLARAAHERQLRRAEREAVELPAVPAQGRLHGRIRRISDVTHQGVEAEPLPGIGDRHSVDAEIEAADGALGHMQVGIRRARELQLRQAGHAEPARQVGVAGKGEVVRLQSQVDRVENPFASVA